MNKKIKILLVVTLLILMVGCSKKINSLKPEVQLSDTAKIKDIKDNGISIEKYTYVLTDDMKLRNESVQAVIDRIPELKEAFKRSKNRIDLTKKINVIPYSNYYNETSQEYSINVLILNTSNKSILSGNFDVHSVLNPNLKVFEGGTTKFTELVKELRPMEFITASYIFHLSEEDNALIEELKPEKIEFVIENLNINGESVSNEN
ncbi:hypothetical protein ACN6J9_00100 [Carnobacterium maltaromaticum]|uniref:hypothetical protein n=1 Tax=Carnobacterium maltaromaticum TaxID=2751 RepID=UPI000704C7A4|nr:hypothetical protein [Carnobacterium maltaromaticum]KRN73901.1 hypothetical protein IV76_GL000020 [Carnobacterium maltaromaticum]MBC9810672.1 hypothetical protein [Carnobacterium maltaromaticum]CRH18381.1 exported hypothetical protein [Carnobacterium maltaromaticum]CRH22428.1 exported hypothetical protein [Carnobacterium maltaromaticum]